MNKRVLVLLGIIAASLLMTTVTVAAAATAQPANEKYQQVDIAPAFSPPGAPTNPFYMHALLNWDMIEAIGPANATVTVTAKSSQGQVKGSNVVLSDGGGYIGWFQLFDGSTAIDLLPGDEIIAETDSGEVASLVLIEIYGFMNPQTNQLSGLMRGGSFPSTGYVQLYQSARAAQNYVEYDLPIAADGSYLLDLGPGVTLLPGDLAKVWYLDPGGHWVGLVVSYPNLAADVNMSEDWVEGTAEPGITVTVTVSDYLGVYKGRGETYVDSDGYFRTQATALSGSAVDILPGDLVLVATAGYAVEVPVVQIDTYIRPSLDMINGYLQGAQSYPAKVDLHTVRVPPEHDYSGSEYTDSAGYFTFTLSGSLDVLPGDLFNLMYHRPDDFRSGGYYSQLHTIVNTSGDFVEGFTLPDTWITTTVWAPAMGSEAAVPASPGTFIKGIASGQTDGEGRFYLKPTLNDVGIDIGPGDTVNTVASGFSGSLGVPTTFTATYDYVANIISGKANPNTRLHVVLFNYTDQWIDANPDGTWVVDLNPSDPQITDRGFVDYRDANGFQARIDLSIPYPSLVLWSSQTGKPSPEGVYAMGFSLLNCGEQAAANVTLEVTLTQGLAYKANSGGLSPSGSGFPGDPLVFNLGLLDSGGKAYLEIYAGVTADVGQLVAYEGSVSTTTPNDQGDPANKITSANARVEPGDTHLGLTISPNTYDPVPDSLVVYQYEVCNRGTTNSSAVKLNVALPAGTSLWTWWPGEQWMTNWQELARSGDTLELSGTTIPYWSCSQAYVKALIPSTFPAGQALVASGVVTASNDLEDSDNTYTYTHKVGVPRPDLYINLAWRRGQLTAGGEMYYTVTYGNGGNLDTPTTVLVTFTFPAYTTYAWAWQEVNDVEYPLTPFQLTPTYAVFEMPALENGEEQVFYVKLGIDDTAPAGAQVTANAQIEVLPGESVIANNTSSAKETLYAHGPNLRVRQAQSWVGSRRDQIAVRVDIENIGDQAAYMSTMTDTYPLSMYLGAAPYWNFSADIHWSQNTVPWFSLDKLDALPGWRDSVRFYTSLQNSWPRPHYYTNTVRITSPSGDVYPSNNRSVASLFINLPPIAAPDSASTPRDTPVTIDLLANDSDPENDPISIGKLGQPKNGSLTNSGSKVIYNPASGFYGKDVFTYTLLDSYGAASDTFVEVNVTYTLRPPVAVDDTATAYPGVAVNIPVLANDYDPGGASLSVYAVGSPAHGEVTRTNTMVTYRALVSFYGQDVFTYTCTNNNGGFATANVTVTVYPAADLEIVKTGWPAAVAVSDSLTYSLKVSNLGPDLASRVSLKDTLPSGLVFQQADPPGITCTYNSGQVLCSLGSLAVGSTRLVTITAQAVMTGTQINSARVSAAEHDPDLTNNEDSVQTIVNSAPPLAPLVESLTPNSSSNSQPVEVVIRGQNFKNGATVALGNILLQSVTVVDAWQIQAVVPAGLAPGTYDLHVTNPDGYAGTLLKAFVVSADAAPQLVQVAPKQGSRDVPVAIDIYGANFTPEGSVFLSATNGLSVTVIYLGGATFVDSTHLRGTVPPNIPANIYTLNVVNANGQRAALLDAYRALSPTQNDDLFAYATDLSRSPATLRLGDLVSPTLQLVVHRQGGQVTLADVKVDFYWGGPSPSQGGTLIGRGTLASLLPGGQAATEMIPWIPPNAGNFVLYAVIDPDNQVVENDKTNNIVSQSVVVLPPTEDVVPPEVDRFEINQGAQSTTVPQVYLDSHAIDPNPGGEVAKLLFMEYEYVQSIGDWVPLAVSDWLPYNQANSSFPWALQPTAGVHYLQVWAADQAGNISAGPGQAYINYLPPTAHLVQDEVRVFRLSMAAGQSINVRLTSLSGDADLYIWNPDNTPLYINETGSAVVEYKLTAAAGGVYQIEVAGFTAADFRLELLPVVQVEALAAQPVSPAGRGRIRPLVATSDTPTEEAGIPGAEIAAADLYLPLVQR